MKLNQSARVGLYNRTVTVQTIHSVCPHDCPDSCAIVTTIEDGEVKSIAGNREHPVTRGYLCTKARFYVPRITHPDRLLYPEFGSARRVRAGSSGSAGKRRSAR